MLSPLAIFLTWTVLAVVLTGFLAKPQESDDLRRAILESLSDRERLKSMSANCRQLACEQLSLEIQAKRYAALYQEMLEKSRG